MFKWLWKDRNNSGLSVLICGMKWLVLVFFESKYYFIGIIYNLKVFDILLINFKLLKMLILLKYFNLYFYSKYGKNMLMYFIYNYF